MTGPEGPVRQAFTGPSLEEGGPVTAMLETVGLGKRYGRRWALSDCTLSLPTGKVVGLVGPNGAGKTTLLHLAVGLLAPSTGTISVLGARPGSSPATLGRVGFVAQDTPTYAGLTVAQHIKMGAWLNRGWDEAFARERVAALGLDPRQRAGTLSGGQQAQLALTLAVAKRPELLVLDEPVASLDPLATREFLQALMEVVASHGVSVVLSSHQIADLERVCDYVVVLATGHVALTGEVDTLVATHRRLTGPRRAPSTLPGAMSVIDASHADKQTTVLVRTDQPIVDPTWTVTAVSLDDIILAYMRQARDGDAVSPTRLAVAR
jgi:ABC-2 type transport system ATP-binding protein